MMYKSTNCIAGLTFFLIFIAASLWSDIIPSDRRIDWCPGITGGIPEYPVFCNVLKSPYNADNTGKKDASSAIQNALNDCPEGKAVYLPAGVYRLDSKITISKGVVLRGAGPERTILRYYPGGGNSIEICKNGSSKYVSIKSGFKKGSTKITVSDVSGFNKGDFIDIRQDNDPAIFKGGTESWGASAMGQTCFIVEKNKDVLVLSRPLYFDYNPKMNPRISARRYVQGAGIEKFRLERMTKYTGSNYHNHNIKLSNAVQCWVKEIRTEKCNNSHVRVDYSYQCEIRRSYFNDSHRHDGGFGYGIDIRFRSSDNLIEDNIFVRCRHAMVPSVGPSGNVFGYNYSREAYNSNSPQYQVADICTHGYLASMNLFEGNTVEQITCDNVHGGNPWNTFFRNHVTKPKSQAAVMVLRNNHHESVVGNVLGISGATGDIWWIGYDWGNNKLDSFVVKTTICHGNFNSKTGKEEWDPSISDKKLPESFYLSQKPSFFGNKPWPITGPDCLGLGKIPAHERYETPTGIQHQDKAGQPSSLESMHAQSIQLNVANSHNQEIQIQYSVPEKTSVLLQVYTLQGRLVKSLTEHDKPKGVHEFVWNLHDNLQSGSYLLKLQTKNHSIVKRFLITR